jgi:formyl-CoA transferase
LTALEGMRVLDLGQAESGPACAQSLAWFGADVVRVDAPPSNGVPAALLESALWLTNNMNKRSVVVDYRAPEGLALVHRLVERFDVVIENMRTGLADVLGLGYGALRAINPALIYCSIKGFGTTGPYASYPAFDPVAQATGGGMSMTGAKDGSPLRSNYVVADHVSGLFAANGVLAAWIRRLRTGEGDRVEISMQEAQMSLVRSTLAIEAPFGPVVKRRGNRMSVPTDLYPCAPGGNNDHVYITAPGDRLFDKLAIAIGRPALVTDERFATHEVRQRHGKELWAIIAGWTRERNKWEAMDHLATHGVPAGAVFDSVDLRENPHLVERGAFVDVSHPTRGPMHVVNNAVRTDHSTLPPQPAPRFGEHTDSVLAAELGLSTGQIDDLVARGVAVRHVREGQ